MLSLVKPPVTYQDGVGIIVYVLLEGVIAEEKPPPAWELGLVVALQVVGELGDLWHVVSVARGRDTNPQLRHDPDMVVPMTDADQNRPLEPPAPPAAHDTAASQTVEPTQPKSNPFFWPAEWAVDDKFWREVATRTLAGVLTLLLLGVPVLLYAWSSGTITDATFFPIAIGAGIFVGSIVIYVIALLIVRWVSFRGTRETIRKDTAFKGPIPSASELARLTDGNVNIRIRFNKETLDRLARDESSYVTRGAALTIGSVLAALVGLSITIANIWPPT